MIAHSPVPVAATIGSTGFALLAWGSILLVTVAFVYVVWALLADRAER